MNRVAINGAAGRMGRRLIALLAQDDDLQLAAAIEATGHPQLGKDAGLLATIGSLNLPLTDTLPNTIDVLIDFSVPAATQRALDTCIETKTALVIGTTGLTTEHHKAIDLAANSIPVLQAANMSLGVNLILALCSEAARQLGDDYDIEITDTHHRFKIDAPSGTALAIAHAICDATGKEFNQNVVYGHHGPHSTRQPGQIAIHARRSGDVVGRHTASFATLGEELQLTHIATNRDIFARGALHAAKWLSAQPPRRYSMANVLALNNR